MRSAATAFSGAGAAGRGEKLARRSASTMEDGRWSERRLANAAAPPTARAPRARSTSRPRPGEAGPVRTTLGFVLDSPFAPSGIVLASARDAGAPWVLSTRWTERWELSLPN